MKVKIIQKHKSINPPCEFDLPNFSVLTGKNGSGKTHLLEAISDNAKSQVFVDGTLVLNPRYIKFNGLNPNITETCDPQTISQTVKNTWVTFGNGLRAFRENEPTNTDINRFFDYTDVAIKRYVVRVIEGTKKEIDDLTEEDFSDYFDISLLGQSDFFTAQFAVIFKDYHRRQEENNYNAFCQSKGLEVSQPVLSDEEFYKKFGIPPWDFLNKILLETKIPYEVNNPTGTRIDSNFTFKLKDATHGFEILSMDLSTGEKVLMSLALAIYNTAGDFGKPDLLLLDEPDAGLHPSMSKLMVEVLNKYIVNESNIPTVISTHSPTTIIASDGVSIYQMMRGNSMPNKISVQQAVELLSSDIPFLKISNDKRRQVFVESKYDVNYYELLTNIYSRVFSLPAEPIYIPARTSSGSNCADVKEVVSSLSANGNDQVYGIIDWDKANSSTNKIIVLGENERYAIENYLLDPLLMGLLFLRERKLGFADFGLTTYSNYADISKLKQSDAQLIIDRVLLKLGLSTGNIKSYTLQNGWTLNIYESFNFYQGHDLESLYKTKYPFLNAYQREDSLKKDLIEKVINDYPNFAPEQIFITISKIK